MCQAFEGERDYMLWLTWIITSEIWGMLPMNIVLAFIFAKNYFKWAAEEYPIIE